MFNRKAVHEFISRLCELFAGQNLSLSESLEIMEEGRHKNCVKKACSYIKNELLQGNMFSNALKTCDAVRFDRTSVSFVELAERTGNLSETITFLKERSERREKIFQTVIEASVYPVFVLVLSLFVSVFLWSFAKDTLGKENFSFEIKSSFLATFSFLVFFCVSMSFLIKNKLCDNRLFEAFLSTGFLIKSGVNAAVAVGLGAGILGHESRQGQIFMKARLRMEYGMDIERVFFAEKKAEKLLGREIKQTFYYSQKSGGKNDVFEKTAALLWKSYERKSRMWLSMVEPVFIAGTGIFIGILIVNFFMPLMDGLNLI